MKKKYPAIKRLEGSGKLKKLPGGGRGNPNRYMLLPETVGVADGLADGKQSVSEDKPSVSQAETVGMAGVNRRPVPTVSLTEM